MTRHLILCGGLAPASGETGKRLDLAITEQPGGIDLRVEQLSRKLVADIPDALTDLLEIAAYIYAADSQTSRGGEYMHRLGADWRRHFKFVIPVRRPQLWSSPPICNALAETIGFLSDDSYEFRFENLNHAPEWQRYFDFGADQGSVFAPDDILLFSGGLDSFSGLLDEIAGRRRVALVSHRSSPKAFADQDRLLKHLESRIGSQQVLHVPVRLTLATGLSSELTHRTRSFLYASLGFVVAQIFGRKRLRFYENGVISLHFPISAHVLGARATRSTHPRVLNGFTEIFSRLINASFEVENPFFWKTKTEVVHSIIRHGFADLIALTRSCANVRGQTVMHPHCGYCSQCIDRRFATLAAAAEDRCDPKIDYGVDLFEGPRAQFEQVSMLASYVSTVSMIEIMSDRAFFAKFGEAARAYRYLSESAPVAGEKMFHLYKRHAVSVCEVLDKEIANNASRIRGNLLPPSCLLMIAASQRAGQIKRAILDEISQHSSVAYEGLGSLDVGGRQSGLILNVAFDEAGRRVVIEGLGHISGASYDLLEALRPSFRRAREAELRPERHPFLKASELAQYLNLDEPSLRKRVSRFRNEELMSLCNFAGHSLPEDAIIENLPWHGYRLNPFHIRLVALSQRITDCAVPSVTCDLKPKAETDAELIAPTMSASSTGIYTTCARPSA